MMNLNKLHLGRAELLAVLAAVTMTAAIGVSSAPSSTSAESEVLTWDNTITIRHNGETLAKFHNVLTDQGQNWILNQISDDHVSGQSLGTNASYISVGNGTAPSASTTQLDQEIATGGLSRTEGTTKTFGPGEFQVKNQFTATADIGVVNTTGLNWDSSGTSLISGGAFGTEANIITDDKLTVIHNITIS